MTISQELFRAVIALPADGEISGATRQALQALAWFADHGVNDPPQAWLAHWAGVTRRCIVGAIKTLEANGWIRRHNGRAADGRARRTSYVVMPDKLNINCPPWAEDIAPARPSAANVEVEPGEIWRAYRDHASHGPCASCDVEAASSSHGEPSAYKERARVHARPSLSILPAFASWDWTNEDTQAKAKQVLDICGPGLADVADDEAKLADMFGSLATVLLGTWAQFDFRSVVLPVVARKTAKPRLQSKALRAFYLLTENMIEEHDSLLARERKRHERYASPGYGAGRPSGTTRSRDAEASPPPSFQKQADLLRRSVARMERGEFGHYDLPTFERWAFSGSDSERTEACERALNAEREKLVRVEAQLSGLSASMKDAAT